MSEIKKLIKATRDSTKLWQSGEHQKALSLLNDSIADADSHNRTIWILRLALHAAVLCESNGDLNLARKYREQCVAYAPEDAMALYGLAKVLDKQGETELARRYATKTYEIALRGTDLDRTLIEMVARRWPEIIHR